MFQYINFLSWNNLQAFMYVGLEESRLNADFEVKEVQMLTIIVMQVHLGTIQCHDRSNILNLSGIAFLIHEVDVRSCLELQMPFTMAQP